MEKEIEEDLQSAQSIVLGGERRNTGSGERLRGNSGATKRSRRNTGSGVERSGSGSSWWDTVAWTSK